MCEEIEDERKILAARIGAVHSQLPAIENWDDNCRGRPQPSWALLIAMPDGFFRETQLSRE
jgi:hypothetical protein